MLRSALPEASNTMAKLRERLEEEIIEKVDDVTVNGEGPRVVNVTNLAFHGVEGEALLSNLDMAGLSVSHGSACSSGAIEPSRVLLNMGLSREVAASSIRFSLSRMTTEEEIDSAVNIVVDVVGRLRSLLKR